MINSALVESKMHSDKRALVIRPKEGVKVKNSIGLVDPRLFTGENTVHAIRDPMTVLWKLKYESGTVPDALKRKWTKFNDLLNFTKTYFGKRGLDVIEVIDVHG